MKKMLVTTCATALCLASLAAEPSYSFTYQAALRDERGNPIMDGDKVKRNQELIVRLWDAPTGGNLLWGREFAVYTDDSGLFNLEICDPGVAQVDGVAAKHTALADALSAALPGSVYIGIQVDGSASEISPRQRVFSVPYASVASEARKLRGDVTVDGTLTVVGGGGSDVVTITSDGISQSLGSSVFNNLQVNSRVDAGSLEVGSGSVFNGDAQFGGSVAVGGEKASVASFTVASKNFGVDKDGNTKTGGKLEVSGGATIGGTLSAKSLEVGGAALMPVPLGGIIMWSSTTPPSGDEVWATSDNQAHWAICNGDTINNIKVPDLRGRFIVGASNTGDDPSVQEEDKGRYSVGVNGGAHEVALTTDQLPSHSHKVKTGEQAWIKVGAEDNAKASHLHDYDDDYSANRSYRESAESVEYTTGSSGSGKAHQNLPPYYALFYIIRVR